MRKLCKLIILCCFCLAGCTQQVHEPQEEIIEENPFDWIKEADTIEIIYPDGYSITYENNDFFTKLADELNADAEMDNEISIGGDEGFLLRTDENTLLGLGYTSGYSIPVMMDDNVYNSYSGSCSELIFAHFFDNNPNINRYGKVHEAANLNDFFYDITSEVEPGVINVDRSYYGYYGQSHIYNFNQDHYILGYFDKYSLNEEEAIYDWEEGIAYTHACEYDRYLDQYSEQCDDYDKQIIQELLRTFLKTVTGIYIEEDLFLAIEDDYVFENEGGRLWGIYDFHGTEETE